MMESYHHAWLSVHPERTEQWLKERLADGFHVHHIDGDHFNDDPKNLVLIEAGDHMMLHNGSSRLLFRPPGKRESGGRKKKLQPSVEEMRLKVALADEKAQKRAARERKTALRVASRARQEAARAARAAQAASA